MPAKATKSKKTSKASKSSSKKTTKTTKKPAAKKVEAVEESPQITEPVVPTTEPEVPTAPGTEEIVVPEAPEVSVPETEEVPAEVQPQTIPTAGDTEIAGTIATTPPDVDVEAQDVPTVTTPDPAATTPVPTDTMVEPAPPEIEGDQDFVAEEKSGGKKLLIVFILALVFGGAGVAGFFYFFNPYADKSEDTNEQTQEVVNTETEAVVTPDLEEEPEASIAAEPEEVDLSTISVQILNGSGIAGEAGAVQDLLVDQGFEVFDLGNASSYDYTTTDVQVKEGTSLTVFETIQDALTADGYEVAEDTALEEDNNYDVIIVVGTKE